MVAALQCALLFFFPARNMVKYGPPEFLGKMHEVKHMAIVEENLQCSKGLQ